MSEEAKLREQICLLAKSLFDRGLTGGSTGNISARTADGGLLVSPTGTSFGRLDPGRLVEYDRRVKAGEVDDPTWWSWWNPPPPDADYRDPATWAVAHPAYGDWVTEEYLTSQLKQLPAP